MSRSTTSRTIPVILAVIVLLTAIAIGATGVLGRTPAPAPSNPPTVAPSIPPTVAPSLPPTVEPSTPPADGVFEVDLENLTDHDVSVSIDDETGSIVEARSGTPGDGMSVRWFDVAVENIDAETLRVVWVGLPRDEDVHVGVWRENGNVSLLIEQEAPPANSDAVGFDRILELTFVVPVRAEDVVASVVEAN